MAERTDFFADSATYDRAMGRLSRIAGAEFLDWLALPVGLRWLDVGCGTGSFTELLLEHAAPAQISAIDPSADQIAYAQAKPVAAHVEFRQGDAATLAFADDAFDVAVLALVVQYLPDPAAAMAELFRVVRPGGTVAAYVWPGRDDLHPLRPLHGAIAEIGGADAGRPGSRARSMETLVTLFAGAGLDAVDTRTIDLTLTFRDFDDFWSVQAPENMRHLDSDAIARVRALLRERLPTGADGSIAHAAQANAIRGRVPDAPAP